MEHAPKESKTAPLTGKIMTTEFSEIQRPIPHLESRKRKIAQRTVLC